MKSQTFAEWKMSPSLIDLDVQNQIANFKHVSVTLLFWQVKLSFWLWQKPIKTALEKYDFSSTLRKTVKTWKLQVFLTCKTFHTNLGTTQFLIPIQLDFLYREGSLFKGEMLAV